MTDPSLVQYAPAEPSAAAGVIVLVIIATLVVSIASLWRLFESVGEPGWAAVVPVYNLVVTLRVAGMSAWWMLALLIPYVGVLAFLPVALAFAQRFGRGAGFGVGIWLFPFIFFPILAFSAPRGVP